MLAYIPYMGLSENSVPHCTQWFINDHYPYEKWLFHWEYSPNIFRQTHMDPMG